MSTAPSPGLRSGSSRLAIVLMGVVPTLMVLIPWDFGADMNAYRGFMRGTSFTVTILQLLIAAAAFHGKFRLIPAIVALPASMKIGLALFWVICLLSTFTVAANQVFALLGLLQLAVHLLFVLVFIHIVSALNDVGLRHIWLALGWGVVGYAILWSANILLYNPQGEDWVNFVPALTNVRWIGFFALAGFCGGLGALVQSDGGDIDRRRMVLPLIFCTLGFFFAAWTASRGAILAMIIAASFAVYSAKDRKAVTAMFVIAIVIAAAVAAALPTPHPVYGFQRLFGSTLQSSNIEALSSNRIQTWIDTINKITVRPWIGWGIDQFRFSGPEATLGFRHPHQSILQLLFATGVAGAVAVTLIIAPLLRRFRAEFAFPPQWAAGAYLVAGTVYGLYDGFFYYAYPVTIYLVAIAILARKTPLPVATDRSG